MNQMLFDVKRPVCLHSPTTFSESDFINFPPKVNRQNTDDKPNVQIGGQSICQTDSLPKLY